jgi:hypothetical protein
LSLVAPDFEKLSPLAISDMTRSFLAHISQR